MGIRSKENILVQFKVETQPDHRNSFGLDEIISYLMNMECKLYLIAGILFLSLFAEAHGMDKPGPHNGYVQMPGPFHTEVVPEKNGDFKIYLLDGHFQNPLTKNSTVKAKLKQSRSTELTCTAVGDHFLCSASAQTVLKGQLILAAIRDGIPGNEAVYELPLTRSP